tara:strand:+ start:362 stop:874 length:513 start_codon:yes stop_codon:yes gene_type:complete
MTDQLEVPEVVDTFVKGSFNTTSYYKLIACFAGEVSEMEDMADGAVAEAIAMGQTTPWQAFSGATLALALALLFLGFYLVRIVNFVGGFYLGSSLSLFLITLFAAELPVVRAARLPPASCARATHAAAALRTARRAHAASLCARHRRCRTARCSWARSRAVPCWWPWSVW